MSTAELIAANVRISEAARSLGAGQMRAAGKEKYRARAWWRDGDGWSISLDDSRGVWFDHRDAIGGGIVDLVVHVRGCERQDALKWLALLAGVELDDKPLSPSARAAYAGLQDRIRQNLPSARRWRRAALAMCESVMAQLRVALYDREYGVPQPDELARQERFYAILLRLDDAPLVDEYRDWLSRAPELTISMVRAVTVREVAERCALKAYWSSAEEVRP